MIDDEWLRALGQAVLYFSFLETAVVAIISSLTPTDPSYMEKALDGRKTAGQVGKDLKTSIDKLPKGNRRSELEQLATRFVAAVDRRNDMLHAMPASLGGEHTHLVRLTRDKFVVWSTSELLRAANEFEKLADDLNAAHFQTKAP
ncbi:hypothetical protein [Bradyrhizobium sp. SZCCHNS3051]|uniref:hypothetical protein n=1 Tax=Bradyrhizobium sp. SZCCHNS3051 TaxID=3057320 RepID=UPI00291653C1|nr:hypothetical protein [Bradyrhizobium sp. SZCCHNS3051]